MCADFPMEKLNVLEVVEAWIVTHTLDLGMRTLFIGEIEDTKI
ncbi:hypothetical protein FACS1894216_07230 [Synergistales bacterium]|nr:hypothetical protein FACS1894216_07230 [Synergistales bacterium]